MFYKFYKNFIYQFNIKKIIDKYKMIKIFVLYNYIN